VHQSVPFDLHTRPTASCLKSPTKTTDMYSSYLNDISSISNLMTHDNVITRDSLKAGKCGTTPTGELGCLAAPPDTTSAMTVTAK